MLLANVHCEQAEGCRRLLCWRLELWQGGLAVANKQDHAHNGALILRVARVAFRIYPFACT